MLNTRSATELYPPPRKWCIFEVSYSIAGNFLGSLTRERSSVLSSLFSWKEELSSGPSTRPSLAEPLLCKSYQVTRKSILPVLFPRPVFDFFHVRYIKGPDQPYICLKSEERKLYLKCESRWNKELLHQILEAFESSQKVTLCFLQKATSRAKEEKLIRLIEWNNWAMPICV